MRKILIAIFFWLSATAIAQAQHSIDEVVAVIGDEMVLRSDLEQQMTQAHDVKDEERANMRCYILEQLIQRKVLLVRAKADSLKVSDEQVEGELERRLNIFIQQIGSVEKLEQYYHKSVVEIKNDFRTAVKEQLLTDQMQSKITGSGDVTPADVIKYFQAIPVDSLPYYNTEVEVGQIVVFPKITPESRAAAIEKVKAIRKDILGGSSFANKAIINSADNGSALKGGDLGMMRSDAFVPEFAQAALKLKKDEISDVVESKFGFHIIQMIDRKGEMIHVRHILIKPDLTQEAADRATKFLDSLRGVIKIDTLKFAKAAEKFSEDQETKNRGGLLVDSKSNSSRISVDELDGTTFFTIDKLQPGEISAPVAYINNEARQGYRLLYLKSKIAPHKANMSQDYPKLKQIAQEAKKIEKLQAWFKKYIPMTFVQVNGPYKDCEGLKKFLKK